MQAINRGDIYYYNFGSLFKDHLEGKYRPCVVVSANAGLASSEICIVAPMTSRFEHTKKPYHCYIKALNGKCNTILCEQITCVAQKDLGKYIGRLSESEIYDLNNTLAVCLDLPRSEYVNDIKELLINLENSVNNIVQHKMDDVEINANIDASIINDKIETTMEANFKSLVDIINNSYSGIDDLKKLFKMNNDNTGVMISKLIDIFTTLKKEIGEEDDNTSILTNNASNCHNDSINNNNDNTIKKDDKGIEEKSKPISEDINKGSINKGTASMYNDDIEFSKLQEKFKDVDFAKTVRWNVELANYFIELYSRIGADAIGEKYNLKVTSVRNKRSSAVQYLAANGYKTTTKKRITYTKEYCLDFLKNYKEKDTKQLMVIYGVSSVSALYSRKKLITQWLDENNIPYENFDKRGK